MSEKSGENFEQSWFVQQAARCSCSSIMQPTLRSSESKKSEDTHLNTGTGVEISVILCNTLLNYEEMSNYLLIFHISTNNKFIQLSIEERKLNKVFFLVPTYFCIQFSLQSVIFDLFRFHLVLIQLIEVIALIIEYKINIESSILV